MSVINQVLNQIEQRGAQRLSGQTMVRAVPPVRDTRKLKAALLVLGAVLAVGALVWQWPRIKKPAAVTASNVQAKPVTVIAAPASGVMNEPVAETLVPASQLSPELSAVTPPSPNAVKGGDAAAPAKPLGQSTKPLLSPHNPSTDPNAVAPARPLSEPNKPLPSRRGLSAPPRALASERPLSESSETPQNQGSLPDARAAAPASSGDLPKKQISPAQQADAEFHKASGLVQQGNSTDALAGYEAALRLNPGHDAARQALVALLLENKRGAEAERVLHEGIKSRPEQASFAMLLARLQVERGAVGEALATLEKSLPFADQQADYQAFLAALLQRQNRHNEAIAHYQIVLQLAPNNGIWLMGYGISLRAVQRNAEAKDAFKRALETQTLSPELREFVQQKLKGL
ncbi:MAG: tetratricopeptide repeat protein [Gallionella sp.]|nr:tetratricopeptide repeat protein [Gallionella sp.]